MFRFLVTQSLRNRLFVLTAAAALVIYGLFIQYNLNAHSKPGPNRYESLPAE